MAIIRDYKEIECLGQFDDIVIYIKKADNKFFDESTDVVVTGICFKDLEGNTIYKYNSYNSYICRLENNKTSFNLNDFIEDLALYISKCNIDSFYKNKTIESVLNNEYRGLFNIKNFRKEYYNKIAEEIRMQKVNEYRKQIELIKKDIDKIIEEIKSDCKEEIRINYPDKYNNYSYELMTRKTYKKLKTLGFWDNTVEEIEGYKNILKFFTEYLYYIQSDFDPVEFLKFDKVI